MSILRRYLTYILLHIRSWYYNYIKYSMEGIILSSLVNHPVQIIILAFILYYLNINIVLTNCILITDLLNLCELFTVSTSSNDVFNKKICNCYILYHGITKTVLNHNCPGPNPTFSNEKTSLNKKFLNYIKTIYKLLMLGQNECKHRSVKGKLKVYKYLGTGIENHLYFGVQPQY